jgi:hypothetical protein
MTLTCPFHLALYQIECLRKADECQQYIHPDLGKGHSNLPEAAHNVYIRYRSKSVQLERLHYCISTNLAVLQSAVNWASDVYGSQYYWVKELYDRMELPVTDGMLSNIKSMLSVRSKVLEAQKSETKKKYRVRMKKARLEENEERKRWMKTQAFTHDYGSAEDESEDEVDIKELREEIGKCTSALHNEAILLTSNFLVTATKEA